VHGIVAAHDGMIAVTSQLGCGGKFSIALPVAGRYRVDDGRTMPERPERRDALRRVATLPRRDLYRTRRSKEFAGRCSQWHAFLLAGSIISTIVVSLLHNNCCA
jgi:hypothetical protein